MTEAEWLACMDPTLMLEFLRGKVSDRKLRLFACACCRRGSVLLTKKCRKSLETAERYADGELSEQKLFLARFRATVAARVYQRREETAEGILMSAVASACEQGIGGVSEAARNAAIGLSFPIDPVRLADARREQVLSLRCIFGNPFYATSLDQSWLAWNDGTAAKLAKGIYTGQCFDRFPILADALEDAGCINAEILTHCRSEGPHVRGCWVIDLLLGKE
jgi:hypothetical protein